MPDDRGGENLADDPEVGTGPAGDLTDRAQDIVDNFWLYMLVAGISSSVGSLLFLLLGRNPLPPLATSQRLPRPCPGNNDDGWGMDLFEGRAPARIADGRKM